MRLARVGLLLPCLILSGTTANGLEGSRPNIVLYFADDISPREFAIYGTPEWSPPERGATSDPQFRARTPVMDRLANEGVWIETAWAATLCKPSRAMILTGRYANRHGWWSNRDIKRVPQPGGWNDAWHIYESSPLLLSHLASEEGYGTYWVGKFHLSGDYGEFGFDEVMITPGMLHEPENPHSDFQLDHIVEDGERVGLRNKDTGEAISKKTYSQDSWYWQPNVRLWNHPSTPDELVWWPNTPEAQENFGVSTYGPDLEMEFVLDFIERTHAEGKPFFIYHASHLGHDQYDFLNMHPESSWPGTPIIEWDGEAYTYNPAKITGDRWNYDTHGTVTEPGMDSHIEYMDFQIWQYVEKFKELGVLDNTIFIITADNGSGGYGKNSADRQMGCHVPMIIYAPGMSKEGQQEALVSIVDMWPTIAELAGFEIPEDYEYDGVSLVPFLFGDEARPREYIYSYRGRDQIIRGQHVMRDGNGRWWDVSEEPVDYHNYPQIKDWSSVPDTHREEREKLLEILPRYQ
ncbi:MAG: sulfatase-like hydrolase/transferase [Verrucomicrobiota bacterium]